MYLSEKVCNKCGETKSLDSFITDRNCCKVCRYKQTGAYYQKHKKEHSVFMREYNCTHEKENKEYYLKNREEKLKQGKVYYQVNRLERLKKTKEYNNLHKEKVRVYRRVFEKEKRSKNIQYRVACNLRTRLNSALRDNQKAGSAVGDLGCSIEFLKTYLESLFKVGMSWENHGCKRGCWSIDHIKPLSKFCLSDRAQFLEANHYTNLQPMWHVDNIKKGNRLK